MSTPASTPTQATQEQIAAAVAGKVTVWHNRYLVGWRGEVDANNKPIAPIDEETGERKRMPYCPTMPLGQALDAEHADDAHFVPYVAVRLADAAVVTQLPRLNIDCLPALAARGLEVRFGAIAIDVDDKADDRHKKGLPARDEWRVAMLRAIAALPSVLRAGMGRYDTKGGFRLVWLLADAPTIPEYIGRLVCLVRKLRQHGIDPDEFRDWNRCYRLPRVVRDRKPQRLTGAWDRTSEMIWRARWDDLQAVITEETRKYTPRVSPCDSSGNAFDPLPMMAADGVRVVDSKMLGAGGTLHVTKPCMCHRQEDNGCAVTVGESGAIGIVCKHASCDYSESKMRPGEAWMLWRSRHDDSYHTELELVGAREWVATDWSCYARLPVPAQAAPEAPAAQAVGADQLPAAAAGQAAPALPAVPDDATVDPLSAARAVCADLPSATHKDLAAPYTTQVLDAAIVLRDRDMGAFARLKADLRTKKGFSLRDWDKAIAARHKATEPARKDKSQFEIGDHAELARLIIDGLQKKAGHDVVYDLGSLHTYDAKIGLWRPVPDAEMSRTIQSWSGKPVRDGEQLKVSDTTVRGSISLACHIPAGEYGAGFFSHAPRGVAFSNGFVQVVPGGIDIMPLAPDHRQLYALPFAYDPQATAPRWQQFLREIFAPDGDDAPVKARLAAQFAGACFLGMATRYQRAMVLIGGGNNGKSVFLDVISELFPDSVRGAIPPQRLGNEYYRAKLIGVRFNVIGEMPSSDVQEGDAFKGAVDGTRMDGRHPHGRPIDFVPVAGHLAATNKLFSTPDLSEGFYRRWLLLAFNRHFKPEEEVKRLQDIITEAEMPGVARWALEGAVDLMQTEQYVVPRQSQDRIDDWRASNDPISLFLGDCTAKLASTKARAGKKVLYTAYTMWITANGHRHAMTSSEFLQRLRDLGIGEDAETGDWCVELLVESDRGGSKSAGRRRFQP